MFNALVRFHGVGGVYKSNTLDLSVDAVLKEIFSCYISMSVHIIRFAFPLFIRFFTCE